MMEGQIEEEAGHGGTIDSSADLEAIVRAANDAMVCLERLLGRISTEHMRKQDRQQPFSHGSRVKLNVGGVRYETTVGTLRNQPDSMLSAMFSGQFGLQQDPDGSIFIDRDGEVFKHILAYLRDGVLDVNQDMVSRVKREFQYFNIRPQPIRRERVCAVTGLEMLKGTVPVFVTTVRSYHADEDRWKSISSPVETPRKEFAVTAVNGYIFSIGGYDGNVASKVVEKYNIEAKIWTPGPHLDTARYWHCAVTVGDAVYVLGGQDRDKCLDSVERLDKSDESWELLESMPFARKCFGACSSEGKIYVIGGADQLWAKLDSVLVLECKTMCWSNLPPLPERVSHVGVAVLKGVIFACGGEDIHSKETNVVRVFEPATQTWRLRAPMKTRRAGHTLFASNGYLFAVGGRQNSIEVMSMERYDPRTDTWEIMTAPPFPGTTTRIVTMQESVCAFAAADASELNESMIMGG